MPKTSTIILSHRTAAKFYLHCDPNSSSYPLPCNDNPLPRANLCGQMPEQVPKSCLDSIPEFLVGDPRERRQSKTRIAHCCTTAIPRGSFWKFAKRAYIVSPALCFVQMARILPLTNLVEFGINLCAKYYIDEQTGALKNRNPIINVDSLRRQIEELSNVPGYKTALTAMRWVSDNAASPMETKLYILISFPVRLGGYGIKDLVMNHRVNPGRDKKLVEQEFFSIDLCQPEKKVGIEYYGKDTHENVIDDRRRLDGLEALGWRMVVIDKWRMYDIDAFDVAALQIARHLGKRIRKSEPAWHKAAFKLRRELRLE